MSSSTIETLKISNIGTGEALDGRLFGNSRVASIDSDGDAALEASGRYGIWPPIVENES